MLGGPLYQMLLRLRMLQPPLGLLYRRLVVIPVLAWMPLLILSLMDGRATGGVAIPFLFDISAYARFLVAMPILILAEPFVHYRLRDVIRQFDERRVIPPAISSWWQQPPHPSCRWSRPRSHSVRSSVAYCK